MTNMDMVVNIVAKAKITFEPRTWRLSGDNRRNRNITETFCEPESGNVKNVACVRSLSC
jgi:hypothetical protein